LKKSATLSAAAKMPEEVEKQARKELRSLAAYVGCQRRYSMIRTYLDWLTELPWSVASTGVIDIAKARESLTKIITAWIKSSSEYWNFWPCES